MKGKVYSVFFSPTGSSKRITEHFSCALAKSLGTEQDFIDLTRPENRGKAHEFSECDIVVAAFPVYGGRVPPVCRPSFELLKGSGFAVPLAVYGNRHYDDALLEMGDLLSENGFNVTAGAALIAEHSMTSLVGTGRPNSDDLNEISDFAEKCAGKIKDGADTSPVFPGNNPYKELKGGSPVYPITNDSCVKCGACASVCPMGIIASDGTVKGEGCIKCAACVKTCPVSAKSFTDEGALKIKAFLEQNCANPRPNEFYI